MEENKIVSYRDLIVWQKSMDLVVIIYELTSHFPKDEQYGLISQMRRCAVSVPSNIAEGKMRGTKNDFRHFLINSFASGAELETQLEITKRLKLISDGNIISKTEKLLEEIMKMLNTLIHKLA